MSSEQSFPQFSRLPAELQLQILSHHLDNSLGRHHYFKRVLYNVSGGLTRRNYFTRTYQCIDAATKAEISNDATNAGPDLTDCIYTNDGLASERIPLGSSFDRQGPVSFSHIWAQFATDVFTFEYRDPNRTPGHWFWRIQKLALSINSSSLAWGYVLTDFDKEMLRRTRALQTIYVVANSSIGPDEPIPCSCEKTESEAGAVPRRIHLDGFIAPEDYPLKPQLECPEGRVRYGTRHTTLDRAKGLKDELEDVFRGRSGDQSVDILVVFSPQQTVRIPRWTGHTTFRA
ncbi:hypothetical protein PG993_000021 [Apiospora rasikravindrae]|uniref:F-box domain-containing protein n=1 Tax=Apiospora rasikravindrae TaxID=990691 RepID=A0ABR1U7D4_9PEZI